MNTCPLCVCVCVFARQASAERNYHIFYQLCASRELPEMRSFKLGELFVVSTCQYFLSSIAYYGVLTACRLFSFQTRLSISATPAREERCRFPVLMICRTWSALAMPSPF